MNLLAHAVLACISLEDHAGQECTGALMADFFTGHYLADFPEGIQQGIRQHWDIDRFTDSHPAFRSCMATISAAGAPRFSSGILTDIFWDHVLATGWPDWGGNLTGLALQPFCSLIYQRLASTSAYHTKAFARATIWISGMDWLSSYAGRDGITHTLHGIAGRMSGGSALPDCIHILDEHYASIQEYFAACWPALVAYARTWPVTDARD
jgi:acyl carrier protein phosphodiesterase